MSPPMICAAMYDGTSRHSKRFAVASPMVTAGFKWQPETGPRAYAHPRTVRPNASATPSNPMPTLGNAAEKTAAPQPPKTRTNVPMTSAASLRMAQSITDRLENAIRRRVEIGDQAEGGEELQDIVRAVHLPPEEPLARRPLVVVVVIVPALAHGD